ncbi:hypothetical protein FHS56_000285 [Thermonema lapsum]|uniref:Fibronectin type-III domain-containing protein n=1 Tax=Thermonema lapsum TaxID=28195 RepID=A0A846MMV7_9BACT|nr:choice-of-anchor J domain-containing protein [Thermonema lapsum]NIK72799.1 hypothetical protein [Thermonema lapsum]
MKQTKFFPNHALAPLLWSAFLGFFVAWGARAQGSFKAADAPLITAGTHTCGSFSDGGCSEADLDNPDGGDAPTCARWFKYTATKSVWVEIDECGGTGNVSDGSIYNIFFLYEYDPVNDSRVYLENTENGSGNEQYNYDYNCSSNTTDGYRAYRRFYAQAGKTYYIQWTDEFGAPGDFTWELREIFDITTSNITHNSVDIEWNAAVGAATYKVYRATSMNDGGTPNDPSDDLLGNDSTEVHSATAAGTYTDNNLQEATEYYYRVIAYNGSGTEVGRTSIVRVLTDVYNNGQPFVLREGFEAYYNQVGALSISGWNNVDNNTAGNSDNTPWEVMRGNVPYSGSAIKGSDVNWRDTITIVSVGDGGVNNSDNWLITPQLTIPPSGAELLFWGMTLGSGASTNAIRVYVSTTGNTVGNFTGAPLLEQTNISGDGTFKKFSVDLSTYAGQNIYLAIRHTSIATDGFTIDDIVVRALPEPQFNSGYPNISNIGTTSFRINVSADVDGTAYAVVVPDGAPAPTSQEAMNGQASGGGAPSASGSVSITANTVAYIDIIGLSNTTAYDVYVVLRASSGGLQSNPTKLDVTTLAPDTPNWASTYPKMGTVTDETATLLVKIDRNGAAYAVVVPDGATAPTAAEVRAGQAAGGAAPVASGRNTSLIQNLEGSIAFSGLSSNTAYDVYVVAESSGGTMQPSPTKVDFTTLPPQPPVFSNGYPTITNVTYEAFDGVVRTNKSGTAYLVVLSAGATAPTAAEVKAGQAAGGSAPIRAASVSMTANQDAVMNVRGLNPGTTYDVYFVAESNANVLQASPVKRTFTTVAEVTALESPLSTEVKLYPNPSRGAFMLDISNLKAEVYKVHVLDVSGKTLTSIPVKGKKMNIDLSAYGRGMYWIQLESSEGVIPQRVVIE